MFTKSLKLFLGIALALAVAGGFFLYRHLHPALYRIPNDSDPSGKITFFAVGDQGSGSVAQWQVASAMEQRAEQAPDLDFVMLLGDNFYIKEPLTIDSSYWNSRFESVYSGKYLSVVPFYAVLGNHDYRESESDSQHGNSPDASSAEIQIEYAQKHLGSNRWRMPAHYYAKDFETYAGRPVLRVVFLDTNLDRDGLLQEAAFIKKQFANSPTMPIWKIVVGHHPLHTYGKHHGENPAATQILLSAMQESSVDAYLSGHDHNQQAIVRDGEPYQFISGTGGDSVYPVKMAAPDLKYANAVYGFLEAQVTPEQLELSFVDRDNHTLASYRVARDCRQSKTACLLSQPVR